MIPKEYEYHPITEGIPEYFELKEEEMYGEFFDILRPDDIIFMGWFSGGEVFRSVLTFTRSLGKIFYFQPRHESQPTYYNEYVRKIIKNAVKWAKPVTRAKSQVCSYYRKNTENYLISTLLNRRVNVA